MYGLVPQDKKKKKKKINYNLPVYGSQNFTVHVYLIACPLPIIRYNSPHNCFLASYPYIETDCARETV